MNFFKKILNTGESSLDDMENEEQNAVDVIPQSIKKLLDDGETMAQANTMGMKKTVEVVADAKDYARTSELKLTKSDKYKDGETMNDKENMQKKKVDKHINFQEIYQKANIRSTEDSIELVMNTIRKLAPVCESKSLEILQLTVRATLETTGRDLEKIKEDGNHKVTAIKKYKEAVENEINQVINENKNKIIELENKIEQYKMDIQNKKDTAREVNRQVKEKIKEIINATNFLDLEGTGIIATNEEEEI